MAYVIPPFGIYLILYARKVINMKRNKFKILRAQISQNKSSLYIVIRKPTGYTYKKGQYAYLNIPSVSKFQWHPFSIASDESSGTINFVIKNAGDWTGKLIEQLQDEIELTVS